MIERGSQKQKRTAIRSYGISGIKLNADRTEVEQAFLHRFSSGHAGDSIGLQKGRPVTKTDVVNLIAAGDRVCIVRLSAKAGEFESGDVVGIKPGTFGYLQSYRADGTPTNALSELPKFD